ncbi:MAG: hypothetical protein HRU26_01405 [Psychroserpens sp.]|nr:hypothetical protein [Psychroserpens sp.]
MTEFQIFLILWIAPIVIINVWLFIQEIWLGDGAELHEIIKTFLFSVIPCVGAAFTIIAIVVEILDFLGLRDSNNWKKLMNKRIKVGK